MADLPQKEYREKKSKTITPLSPQIDALSSGLNGAVADLKRALSTLLFGTAAAACQVLSDDEPANSVAAMQIMKSSGALDWLNVDHVSDTGPLEEGEESGDPTPKSSLDENFPSVPSLSRPASLPASVAPQSWPPPLPVVRNEALRQQAFTHKSFIKGEEVGLPGTEQRHYERLEFLGDSYLQSIASHLLYNRFPTQREGTLSDMRQQLVANKPLSTYATMYKFHTMVREGKGQENLTPVPLSSRLPGLPRNPQRGGASRALTATGGAGAKADLNKTLADCFEAYIAAIILDDPVHGVTTVTEWLKVLYEPKLREMEMQHSSVAPIDKMAKQTLNTIAGGNKVNIEYKWTDGKGGNKGGFWITVLLTGWGWEEREIGRGWGSNKGFVLFPYLSRVDTQL